MCAHSRRAVLALLAGFAGWRPAFAADRPHALFVSVAFAMKERAVENGDQPYGAVVVLNGDVIGYGPSRVVTSKDPSAHAEREAIRDAQVKLNRRELAGLRDVFDLAALSGVRKGRVRGPDFANVLWPGRHRCRSAAALSRVRTAHILIGFVLTAFS